jgi:hypothetical protein
MKAESFCPSFDLLFGFIGFYIDIYNPIQDPVTGIF